MTRQRLAVKGTSYLTQVITCVPWSGSVDGTNEHLTHMALCHTKASSTEAEAMQSVCVPLGSLKLLQAGRTCIAPQACTLYVWVPAAPIQASSWAYCSLRYVQL